MSAVRLVPGVGLVMLLVCGLCGGQSLGDAARQNRPQKKTSDTNAKKVYTTDDMSVRAPAVAQGADRIGAFAGPLPMPDPRRYG